MKSMLSGNEHEEDVCNVNIRPEKLDDFTGQKGTVQNLKIFISAAYARGEAMDHVLLCGPPGLGKTTLAHIIAKELRASFRATSGPLLSKAGDLAAILTNLQAKDVLFIDEIHRLSSNIEEVLYTAMEDYCLDIIVGEGCSARTLRIDIPPFTLVGATTTPWLAFWSFKRSFWHSSAFRILLIRRTYQYNKERSKFIIY